LFDRLRLPACVHAKKRDRLRRFDRHDSRHFGLPIKNFASGAGVGLAIVPKSNEMAM
jgi:hypothetical protein